jgi:hypothetical protein
MAVFKLQHAATTSRRAPGGQPSRPPVRSKPPLQLQA